MGLDFIKYVDLCIIENAIYQNNQDNKRFSKELKNISKKIWYYKSIKLLLNLTTDYSFIVLSIKSIEMKVYINLSLSLNTT